MPRPPRPKVGTDVSRGRVTGLDFLFLFLFETSGRLAQADEILSLNESGPLWRNLVQYSIATYLSNFMDLTKLPATSALHMSMSIGLADG